MNKDLNKTAVKVGNETQAKAAIALLELKGFNPCQYKHQTDGWLVTNSLSGYDKIITLDQLAWDYGLLEDNVNRIEISEFGELSSHSSTGDTSFVRIKTDFSSDWPRGKTLTLTRPKQKLQNGEEVKEWVPEVGEEFLTSIGKYKCIAHGVHNGKNAVVGQAPDCIHNFALSVIKPLPTPEEVEREKIINDLVVFIKDTAESVSLTPEESYRDLALSIYDRFLSGK